jgi:hypothetical protein
MIKPNFLIRLTRLLIKTEPAPDTYDVEWNGPYYVPRAKRWYPTHFLLYGGKVYASIRLDRSVPAMAWNTESGGISDVRTGDPVMAPDGEDVRWERALPQLAEKLGKALRDPAAYNRSVAGRIPLEARTGRIRRRLTWPPKTRPFLTRVLQSRLEWACRAGGSVARFPSMSAVKYLKAAAIAYDAVFPKLHAMGPLEKYKSKADNRHGGLLDLPRHDIRAFHRWYKSRAWAGAHPWEIVFAHPDGILLAPLDNGRAGWSFHLSVDNEWLFAPVVLMALALGEAGIPFEFHDISRVKDVLAGTDEVEVGPFREQIPLDEISRKAVRRIRWDPIRGIWPISQRQAEKVEYVLRHGVPPRPVK